MATNKEATIFLLDSSPSMNAPYPSFSVSPSSFVKNGDNNHNSNNSKEDNGPKQRRHKDDDEKNDEETSQDDNNAIPTTTTSTRLSCAKTAIEGMLCDLMIRSKASEAGVIVLKTRQTKHSMEVVGGTNMMMESEDEEDNDKDDDDDDDKPRTNKRTQKSSLTHHDDDDDDDDDDDSDEEEKSIATASSSSTTVHDCPQQPQPQRLPYSNITELGHDGIGKPTLDLLRQVRQVQSTLNHEQLKYCGGDLVDGLIVAADAMYRRTLGKKFQTRRIVLLTDAACDYPIKVDATLLLEIIEGLRAMDCRLQIVGLDFQNSAQFHQPATESLVQTTKDDDQDDKDECHNSDDNDNRHGGDSDGSSTTDHDDNGDESQDDDPENDNNRTHKILDNKNDVEQLLIRLARLTGGSVIAASTMQQIVDSNLGKRIPQSTRRKVTLYLTPQLTIDVRASLLIQKANVPSLKQEALLLDEKSKPMKNGLGDIMTTPITRVTEHWNVDNQEENVPEVDRTRGYKYGSDCIPMGPLDDIGLVQRSSPCIRIIGYMKESEIPKSYLIGPPSVLSGEDKSRRACAALSAWSQSLHTLESVAICTYIKTKDADPILGALFPFLEENDEQDEHKPMSSSTTASSEALSSCRRPYFMQLPYANDVQKLRMPSLESILVGDEDPETKSGVCDDLIDSLMLPDDCLQSNNIANPAIRSFYKTIANRAIHPTCPVSVSTRDGDNYDDKMQTNANILDRAKTSLETFRKEFALEKEVETTDSGKPKKKAKFWSDI